MLSGMRAAMLGQGCLEKQDLSLAYSVLENGSGNKTEIISTNINIDSSQLISN